MADTPTTIALSIVNAINAIFGTFINILVCYVIFKSEELQNGLDLLIGNLCLADVVVCALAQPMYIGYLNGKLSKNTERAFECLSVITVHAVAVNLLFIAINRVMAISNPFNNTLIFSKSKVLLLISFTWVFSICLSVFLLYTDEGIAFSPYSHLVIISSFLIAYLRIFWIAHKQQRKIDVQMEQLSHNFRQVRLQRANRAAKTTALIVLSLMVCFFPDTVFDFHPDYKIMDVRKDWLFTLLFLSCLINPCIYMFRTEAFKSALKRIVHIF